MGWHTAAGPEPTTDRFMAIMHNNTEGTIPGNALAIQVPLHRLTCIFNAPVIRLTRLSLPAGR
jgi:EH domain-containing protein 2